MNCPKCGYARKSVEPVPATQCPSCGVYYAKFVEPALPASRPVIYTEARSSWGIGRILAAGTLVAGIAYAASMPASDWLRFSSGPPGRSYELPGPDGRGKLRDVDFSRARIYMYSTTTCVYCAELRRTFEANAVPFTEYFIDTDPARHAEFVGKIQFAGIRGGVGTPSLEVNGLFMPNNPPIEDIIRQARS